MRRILGLIAIVLVLAPCDARPARWLASWATAQQIVEPENMIPPEALKDSTLRQVVHLTLGGKLLRLKLSNAFGTEPLHLMAVHIARPAALGEIDAASDRALSFAGHGDVTIPPGASFVSDPIAFPLAPLSDLAITIRYGDAPAVETGHPGSRATSWVAPGDHLADARPADAKLVDHWYQIAAVEVPAPPRARAVVVLGDSITDGRGSTTNGNDRWPDILARRLQAKAATRDLAVLNAGIGGNRLLLDGKGPGAMARFERDVLAQPGVSTLIVLEGINDLGTLTRDHPVPPADHEALVAGVIAAYEQFATRARAHGIKAFIGTIMPFMGAEVYHPDAANEADRSAVNAWIRGQHVFDGVIDFDKLLHDPAEPDRLLPAYDSGDHIHPSPAGYRLMGETAAAAISAPKAHLRRRH